eukprot:CAMPEP_0119546144 /NCGR_PEP_ID=MMETSP1352-20130426/678_1 /TAXON_ID=265584 /ORGANISM="Stauroneis constricta, Strain CCMP1120" /LENGTH=407 /DNA_ID=CAMNT_0007590809 /DNA_START=148 /DNA_END=1371 /DNA_ORIENTATION=+
MSLFEALSPSQRDLREQRDFANWKETSCGGERDDRVRFRCHLDAIALRQWDKVLAWIAFHPHEVAILRDSANQTVLHHACLFFAPANVMEMILYTAPELVKVASTDDELALHWAIRLSTPAPILSLLLKADPSTAFREDGTGSTPIGLLWERHQNQILQHWREEPGAGSKLHSLHGWKRILMVFEASKTHALMQGRKSSSCASKHCATNRNGRKEEEEEKDSDPPFLPLHAAASRPCPPGLFTLFIKIYHVELNCRDGAGQLPLSIACKNPNANRCNGVDTKIQELLREYPQAAVDGFEPTAAGGLNRRLPLHDALANDVRWEEGLETLLQNTVTHPCILSIADPKTKLHPFALAAALPATNGANGKRNRLGGNAPTNDDNDDTNMLHQFNTSYRLLREDPSILSQM